MHNDVWHFLSRGQHYISKWLLKLPNLQHLKLYFCIIKIHVPLSWLQIGKVSETKLHSGQQSKGPTGKPSSLPLSPHALLQPSPSPNSFLKARRFPLLPSPYITTAGSSHINARGMVSTVTLQNSTFCSSSWTWHSTPQALLKSSPFIPPCSGPPGSCTPTALCWRRLS